MEWISVKDGRPTDGIEVLLAVDGFDVPIQGYYNDFTYEYYSSMEVMVACSAVTHLGQRYIPYSVTHWMPLPKLPK